VLASRIVTPTNNTDYTHRHTETQRHRDIHRHTETDRQTDRQTSYSWVVSVT